MNIGTVVVGERAVGLPTTLPVAGAPGGAAAPAVARPPLAGSPGPAAAGVLGGLLRNVSQASLLGHAEQLGSILTRLTRSAFGGAATGTTGAASTAAASSSTGALAFLKDSKLSVEEKLARLMVYLSDKYEKQLEQKLQQYAALEGGTATSAAKKSSSASSSGGASALKEGLSALVSKAGLGKLLGGGTLQKLAGQLAGPVLAGAATALGLPALAPTLLKAGPLLASFASGAVSALAGEAGAPTKAGSSTSKSATSSSKSATGSSSSASGVSEKQLMTEIQILQEKQKEMFTLVSNILRSQHDTKMAVIGNVR